MITHGKHVTLVETVEFTQIRDTNILCSQLSAEIGLERALWPNELYISSVPDACSVLTLA